MAEETKPVEEVAETVDVSGEAEAKTEETVVETPAAEETPVAVSGEAEARTEAPAEKAEDKPAEKADAKDDKRPSRQKDIFAVIEGDQEEVAKPKRRVKGAKNVPYGIAFIKTSFNNTIVSLTDMRGHVVSWSSAGRCGFKGSRKSTAFAATTVAQEAARGAISHGMNEVEIRVQGPGAGRESAVRAIQSAGLRVSAIKDTTPIPHNGCRPKKQRRV